MRRLMILCVVWGLGVFVLVAQDNTDASVLDSARQAYQEERYSDAISLYEQAIAEGYHDEAVYFNLGNAYYESGQLGQALLNYLRAQVRNPRDEDVYKNIIRIRGQRADYQADEVDWIDWLASSTVTLLTLAELQGLAFGTWSAWFLLLATFFLFQRHVTIRRILIVTLPLLILVLALWGSRQYATTYRPQAVITSLSTDVYSGPSDDYLRLYSLFSAAEVRILAIHGAWARFQLPDGRQGWISRFDFDYVSDN